MLLGAAGLVVTVVAGRWGLGLFTTAEFVHFSVNYPTLPGLELRSMSEIGGPWARDPKLTRPPPGGLLAFGDEGEVVVDLSRRGWLKSLIQPGTLLLSSHWIRNVGTRSRRIALDMDLCGLDLEWVTFERCWDARTQESTRVLEPGDTYNMDWVVRLPPERRRQDVVCAGRLTVLDAEDRSALAVLPITILGTGGA